ncbi:hypothetical protein NDU88_001304 [Pleurodeles waltl]|uniref:Uncharacterized protein n=1 Tax=Pleurodeles waltl TaxID=8319 RepID=A0AAV7SAG8_PLEWA|nr:hypothetical protein NDU88_001304 [Pleurodeles waltl]
MRRQAAPHPRGRTHRTHHLRVFLAMEVRVLVHRGRISGGAAGGELGAAGAVLGRWPLLARCSAQPPLRRRGRTCSQTAPAEPGAARGRGEQGAGGAGVRDDAGTGNTQGAALGHRTCTTSPATPEAGPGSRVGSWGAPKGRLPVTGGHPSGVLAGGRGEGRQLLGQRYQACSKHLISSESPTSALPISEQIISRVRCHLSGREMCLFSVPPQGLRLAVCRSQEALFINTPSVPASPIYRGVFALCFWHRPALAARDHSSERAVHDAPDPQQPHLPRAAWAPLRRREPRPAPPPERPRQGGGSSRPSPSQ